MFMEIICKVGERWKKGLLGENRESASLEMGALKNLGGALKIEETKYSSS